MANIEVVFFDVLGTVVDWRGSIVVEVPAFLKRHDLHGHSRAAACADRGAWPR